MASRFIRYPEVCQRIQLARTTIWRLEREGRFPRRRKLSGNAVAYLESEIEAWIESREKVGGGK